MKAEEGFLHSPRLCRHRDAGARPVRPTLPGQTPPGGWPGPGQEPPQSAYSSWLTVLAV